MKNYYKIKMKILKLKKMKMINMINLYFLFIIINPSCNKELNKKKYLR